ncbi:ABC transporter ATP-binding protein [Azospirillum doebereinerae]|uniref:ABC transporter ATP-binding protein n=1 Tax=Azospirillum doebereinerae TaxID=92933 RepID=UPI001EE567CD|nr:oligopeptide/dipeptide ABC transporter ATP-binding protein [Azospirillum doebereinerae]MCG5242911.1 ATP-binding cassette domain-containing protein [Azospirillum doebereinerae]
MSVQAMTEGATITATGLRKEFTLSQRSLFRKPPRVVAVDDVSFTVAPGTTLGLVGESGSGKTTVARMLLKLETPTSGSLTLNGHDVLGSQTPEQARTFRRTVQAVFQDPYSALSPRLRADRIVGEPLEAQGVERAAIDARVAELFDQVGLGREVRHRYPHEFSGGQRQRIAIARALSTNPKMLVLDEPVSALDVSVRAQILALLRSMQERLGLTYVFIGHDLAIVRYLSSMVGVMYFGRMVEIGAASDVLRQPLHPYSRRLVAVASGTTRLGDHRITGDLPSPLKPPSGCTFRTRCVYADERCRAEIPRLRVAGSGQQVACHHVEAIRDGVKPETGPLGGDA